MKRSRLTLITNDVPAEPDDTLRVQESISPSHVTLVGRDLDGIVRIKVEIGRQNATSKLGAFIRNWIAEEYPPRAPLLRVLT